MYECYCYGLLLLSVWLVLWWLGFKWYCVRYINVVWCGCRCCKCRGLVEVEWSKWVLVLKLKYFDVKM